MFPHLLVQDIKVLLVSIRGISLEALAIQTSRPAADKVILVAVKKALNPAIVEAPPSCCRGKILKHFSCRWKAFHCQL
jgi:hypothetical protein